MEIKKYEIEKLEKVIASLKNEKNMLRKEKKDVEERASKYENNYIPKLKETKKF